ncbi:alpha/beta hydrolase [Oceanobacter sp. 5_MG-2023]|uniref:alpha/beta fold hydrolase n=1 Tax=Oceanobacter sp. 5_MG-2023 TaxID=3062645 RepID=UPI0026E44856|nr:alpha/beta hydrolase [Oceanobacter sp. 5_MG-2023]MDO6681124.1 alpha/beta hydrolase [Oceanobacter sp. 5_MG-2023]
MKPIQFDYPGGHIDGLEWGEPGGLTVIAVHGWLDNALSFAALANQLPEIHLIALDLPGHGLSSWSPSGYPIWTPAEAILWVADQLPQSVHWLGHSMGAAALTLAAGAFPERFASIVLLDAIGPLVQSPDQAASTFRRYVSTSVRSLFSGYSTPEQAIAARLKATPAVTPTAIAPVILRNLEQRDQRWWWRTDPALRRPSAFRLTEPMVEDFLRAMSVPALAVRAGNGMIPEAMFRARFECLPMAERLDLDGHHHLHLESAGAVILARYLNAFWERTK